MTKLPLWLGHIVASILSFLAGMFGTLNVLFSDIFGIRDQAAAVIYVLILYVITSSVLHGLWPGHRKAWRLWLIIPAAIFATFITLSDFGAVVYPLSVMAAVVGGTWLGSILIRRHKVHSLPAGV